MPYLRAIRQPRLGWIGTADHLSPPAAPLAMAQHAQPHRQGRLPPAAPAEETASRHGGRDREGAIQMSAQPHIVLVHGAWADGSSWSAVIQRLQADGYRVAAPSSR
jgi:hypothetical protein